MKLTSVRIQIIERTTATEDIAPALFRIYLARP